MSKGFTLIEVLTVIAILIILAGLAIPTLYHFQKRANLDNTKDSLVSSLNLARQKTIASQGLSQWGVSFDDSTFSPSFTLFKGASYLLREPSFDQVFILPEDVQFSAISLLGGAEEVVFQRITGQTVQYGFVSFNLVDEPTELKTIYIEGSGKVALTTSVLTDEERLKDSRHVHFVYTRLIETSTESIILTFEGGVTEEIVIADNLSGGQIDWQGEKEVAGETQVLRVHSHSLNTPSTIFCIHRDLRYNSKSLEIDLSGDPNYPAFSPTLLEYLADNFTVKGSSALVSPPVWQ